MDNSRKVNRGDRIRTCDLVLPKHPRYQAAPRPVYSSVAGEGRGIAALGPRAVGLGLGAEAWPLSSWNGSGAVDMAEPMATG